MSKCLIIVGMHRSGTSYTTSVLQSAGLNVGKALLGAHESNPKGHFENEDFLNFQMKVLQENNLNADGWDLKTIEFQKKYEDEAKKLIAKNKAEYWGWKDPRTTLFLNFWKHILPDAYFLFVYRAPWEVADSIYRRGEPYFNDKPDKVIDIWTFYNQVIYDFYVDNHEICSLHHIDNIIQQPESILNELNYRFGFNLQLNKNLFDEEVFNRKKIDQNFTRALVYQCSPNAIKIYEQLEELTGRKIDVAPVVNSKMMYNYWYEFNQAFIEINKLNKLVLWMKDSKFWKLRTTLQRITGKNV